ncbi:hypothetical protein ADL26_07875 [Thermoactinomyces vulgaris]|nr:hypothetical protein ADL26_07875 [Thermoactinomyces vulgaris]
MGANARYASLLLGALADFPGEIRHRGAAPLPVAAGSAWGRAVPERTPALAPPCHTCTRANREERA